VKLKDSMFFTVEHICDFCSKIKTTFLFLYNIKLFWSDHRLQTCNVKRKSNWTKNHLHFQTSVMLYAIKTQKLLLCLWVNSVRLCLG